ncbi:caspase family protein [Streptomyces xinghaiensis]|uniref:caspase family protein n=1 Tax=Streptomyces xinghaiensis TaxID=1038928 RepID=UPI003428C4A1
MTRFRPDPPPPSSPGTPGQPQAHERDPAPGHGDGRKPGPGPGPGHSHSHGHRPGHGHGHSTGRPYPDPARSRALLVGAPSAPGFETLRYVKRDLEDLKAALTEEPHGILRPDRVEVLHSPHRPEWLAALERAGRDASDLLFFYFVGHGYRAPHGRQVLHLLTENSDVRGDLPATAVLWHDVLERLAPGSFRHAVLVLDCCYSGTAATSGTLLTGEGYYVLASSQPTRTQPVDGVAGTPPRSRFTDAVITAMAEGGEPGSPGLSMQDLYQWLRRETRRWPKGLEDGWGPRSGSSGDGPGVLISRAVRPGPAPPHPPPAEVPSPPPEPRPPLPVRLLREVREAGGVGAVAAAAVRVLVRRWKVTAPVLGALLLPAVLYACGGTDEPDGPGCAPPTELRVMTGAETRTAVTRAANAYMRSDANRKPLGPDDGEPAHCRRANLTVYEAGPGETAEAFAASVLWEGYDSAKGAGPRGSGTGTGGIPAGACRPPARDSSPAGADGTDGDEKAEDGRAGEDAEDRKAGAGEDMDAACPDPLRDVGPQPDVILAGSSTELGRIEGSLRRAPGPAAVKSYRTVGYSPLVLAVPAALEPRLREAGVRRTGSSWDELLAALEEVEPGLPLLRPDPDSSGAGLQHTVGLYEAPDGRFAGGADRDAERMEKRLGGRSVPAADADTLLCDLTREAADLDGPGLGHAAALVAEKHVADFNLGDRPGADSSCGNSRPADDAARLLAYYPEGVPWMDLQVAEVAWEGAGDAERRSAAVGAFQRWLAGEGSGQLLGGLVRGSDSGGLPLPPSGEAWKDPGESGVLPDVPFVREVPGHLVADAVVADYTRTRDPGQVLFLVDVSGSMAGGGKRELAADALRRALRRLGPQDSYGIRSYPKSAAEPAEAEEVVERNTPGDDQALAQNWARDLPGQRVVPEGAAVYEVLTRALRDTRGDDRPLIVLITDGDDRPRHDSDAVAFKAMEEERTREGSADVLVLSTRLEGCTAEIQGFKNPQDRAECFAGEDAAKKLAEQVAGAVRGRAAR